MLKSVTSLVVLTVILLFNANDTIAKEVPFTLEDRDRLIRLEARLSEIEKRFESIDKRFESIDKRFESIERQIDRQSLIFTTLVVAVIGLALWDRRTIIKRAKEDAITEIEKEGRLKDLIKALRELSTKDSELAKVLKQYGLL